MNIYNKIFFKNYKFLIIFLVVENFDLRVNVNGIIIIIIFIEIEKPLIKFSYVIW